LTVEFSTVHGRRVEEIRRVVRGVQGRVTLAVTAAPPLPLAVQDGPPPPPPSSPSSAACAHLSVALHRLLLGLQRLAVDPLRGACQLSEGRVS
jgi:hypothetical protein